MRKRCFEPWTASPPIAWSAGSACDLSTARESASKLAQAPLLSRPQRRLFLSGPAFHACLYRPSVESLLVGELLALKWEDIDRNAGRLLVKRTLWQKLEGTPKGGRVREIPLSRNTLAVLKAHEHEKSPYVFCTADGARLSHSMVKGIVPMVCTKAGLKKRLTTHDLRHTFASHLVMRGRSIKEVQELLGHQSLQMTMRYAHLAPDVRREAVEALDLPPKGNVAASP